MSKGLWVGLVLGLLLLVLGSSGLKLMGVLVLVVWFIKIWKTRKKIYVRAVKDETEITFGPYKTIEEAEEDTKGLEDAKLDAFKAGSQKGAIRVHLVPTNKWWA